MKRSQILVLALASVLVTAAIIACTPAGAPGPLETPGPVATGTVSKPTQETTWESTVAAAGKEGEMMVYLSGPPAATRAIPAAFNEKFGIVMNVVAGGSAPLTSRFMSEYRAGIAVVDLLLLGPTTVWSNVDHSFLAPIEPNLMLSEVKDPQKWRQGKLPFFDRQARILSYISTEVPTVIYNSQTVKPQDITSYQDLLKPEWKGKIVMFDPSIGGSGQAGVTQLSREWGVDKTKEFLRSLLREQQAVVTRDNRLPVEWVAQGKYPVVLWPQTIALKDFLEAGAPLAAATLKEKGHVSAANGGIAFPTRPLHPNAATVLANWFLSREGQTIMTRSMAAPSNRADVPAEGVHPMFIPKPGVDYFQSDEESSVYQSKVVGEWRTIVASGGK